MKVKVEGKTESYIISDYNGNESLPRGLPAGTDQFGIHYDSSGNVSCVTGTTMYDDEGGSAFKEIDKSKLSEIVKFVDAFKE